MLEKYDYKFPKKLIAKVPASPRDSAKILVYIRKTEKTYFNVFRNIGKYLPQKSVLVMNETKVLPARLNLKKETGGKIKFLYLRMEGKNVVGLCEKNLPVGSDLFAGGKKVFIVLRKQGKEYVLKNLGSFIKILKKFGETPIPPYIKHSPLSESRLRKEYQTVFARTPGSVAAPTASLHFTKKLLKNLKRAGHKIVFVTLHVNLGTFSPVTEENLKSGRLHEEYFEISPTAAQALNEAKKADRPVIAVGTTSLRALESAVRKGRIGKRSGLTDLFIREGHKFKFSDGLITNFHVPKSSLLMLVSAFAGRKNILALYKKAIARKFRLFSFGDGMLIL